jgi:uncharacterized SAM-binding protein YcdF (DUF218 family)
MARFLCWWIEPLVLIWLLALLAVLVSLRRRHWRCAFLAALFAGLLSLTGGSLGVRLQASLERPYAGVNPAQVPPADAVVMLGGVLRASSNGLFGLDLEDSADRATTAAELIRLGKAPVLVLGGGAARKGGAAPSEGELVERWLGAWGFTNHAVILRLGVCENTHDEGERTAALFKERGWKRVILVTSAAHMRRGEGVFRKLGMPVTCVAGDFRALANLEGGGGFQFYPGTDGMDALANYAHEEIGWWVYRLRGWVE